MEIKVGTAGWTDKSLVRCKRFYPRGCGTAEGRLRFYASQFPLVEVDSSYYALPSAPNSAMWAERTPDAFTFNIKAFRLFTGHQTSRQALPKDLGAALPGPGHDNFYYRDLPAEIIDELWRRYLEALAPLQSAGKLGAVLFQFSPRVANSARARWHIDACAQRLAGHTLAVEFRHASWLDERHAASTLAFERERGLVHVIMDAPPGVTNRAHTVWDVTNPQLAIVRMHGRNTASWGATGAAAARFNYDYSDAELSAFAMPVRRIAARVEQTHVIFNNCFEDQGQRNARTFMPMFLRSGEAD